MSTSADDDAAYNKAVYNNDHSAIYRLCRELIKEKSARETAQAVVTPGCDSVTISRLGLVPATIRLSIGDLRSAAEAAGYMVCRWEPIETAQKDGNAYVLSGQNGEYRFCYYDDDHDSTYPWFIVDGAGRHHKDFFTHWLSGLRSPKGDV